jgi:hypothetical protein
VLTSHAFEWEQSWWYNYKCHLGATIWTQREFSTAWLYWQTPWITGNQLHKISESVIPVPEISDPILVIIKIIQAFLKRKYGQTERYGISIRSSNKQTNSVALSPRANHTDWTTATCRRNLVSTFVDRGVSRGQRGGSPTVINLSFLDRSRYFSFK